MGERLDSALLCVTSGVKLKYEAKKPVSKDAVAELKRQMTKVKPESNAKIQGHGAQVKG